MLSNKITILKSIYLSQPRPRQQEETWRVAQSVFSSDSSLYVAILTGDSAGIIKSAIKWGKSFKSNVLTNYLTKT